MDLSRHSRAGFARQRLAGSDPCTARADAGVLGRQLARAEVAESCASAVRGA